MMIIAAILTWMWDAIAHAIRWMRTTRLCLIGLLVLTTACGASAPTAPSTVTATPPPPTAPAPMSVSLTGTVTALGGTRLPGATVTIKDGQYAGRSTVTDSSGTYRFDSLTAANANLGAIATGYAETGKGVFINGTNTLSFTLVTVAPWTNSGSGNTVFDMPTYITRVRIQGRYTGSSSNFIVKIAARLIVNELLGTFWGPTTYDGTVLTTGGVVEITNSSGVAWTMTEGR